MQYRHDAGNVPTRCTSTIHKAKGQEFDHVIVAHCSASPFPDQPDARRLLYVALSGQASQVDRAGSHGLGYRSPEHEEGDEVPNGSPRHCQPRREDTGRDDGSDRVGSVMEPIHEVKDRATRMITIASKLRLNISSVSERSSR
ncbi:MAG: UvrD-like helicase C-terminal domain [Actinomycetota bacterium]|nr:UvrD-like helicase C-terminal domain [Actinomycetota bacterium]